MLEVKNTLDKEKISELEDKVIETVQNKAERKKPLPVKNEEHQGAVAQLPTA